MFIPFNVFTVVVIAIILIDYALQTYLQYINAANSSAPVPEPLRGIYNDEEYRRQQAYQAENTRFSLISSTVSTVIMLALVVFGGFAFVNDFVVSLVAPDSVLTTIVTSLLFFGILLLLNTVLDLPFSYYETFTIEQKYGFNKSTRRLFFSDQIKSFVMTCFVGAVLVSLIQLIYIQTADYFWILAWAVIAVFSVFINMFYTSLIVPMFNKLTPLAEGELRTAINDFASSAGFKLDNIYVIDSSKRTTKANAYFSGLGPKKKIVLYDSLISDLTTVEIVAVLSHEIGHYKHRHTLQMLFASLVNSLILTTILGVFLSSDALAQGFGVDHANFHVNILAFGMIFTPVSFIIDVVINVFSRHNEYQADAFASSHSLGEPLISALKKLTHKSLSNLTPHPLYVFFYYSHPTLLQRINAILKK